MVAVVLGRGGGEGVVPGNVGQRGRVRVRRHQSDVTLAFGGAPVLAAPAVSEQRQRHPVVRPGARGDVPEAPVALVRLVRLVGERPVRPLVVVPRLRVRRSRLVAVVPLVVPGKVDEAVKVGRGDDGDLPGRSGN